MARGCELEIREHVAMRMRRRAEVQKREAEDAGSPTSTSPAELPHFTDIQNVRSPLSKRSESLADLLIDDLPHCPRSRRGSLLRQQRFRSFGHQGIAAVSPSHACGRSVLIAAETEEYSS